jgi:putative DNA primase/helicase
MPLEVWHDLTVLAAELNEYRKPVAREVVGDRREGAAVGDRPGDHFNQRVTWGDVLEPHGWFVFRASGDATYWCRPNKKPAGISASTGFCRGDSDNPLFYVFSTSATPFEAETAYSGFAVYALLNHHGDFRAATRALGMAGYGKPLPKVKSTWRGAR